ncbi:DAD/Ost2 [Blyttiomyces helicus]|uniref:Dolichyl-diphosphooligosaccharide--protein glycosyltransferase subunit OST2 n=1 Tax=Blyttiomyces helicus TaxID=388810 RepID=A0A4P9W791_9FUNG|nr:DAD/Ost2 [Blyttiomyces helicus]|eukprot:RKO86630.1 DAD/Ost2 [Blyttiomyces helicus]
MAKPAATPSPSASATTSATGAVAAQADLVQKLLTSYAKDTPQSLKLIDAYLVFIMLTGILQFVYVFIAGTYPYNSFLAGFIASVGSFVLAANLRIQTNPASTEFKHISPERAFADFAFASVVLYGFVINFLG